MLAKRYACTCAHANHVLLFGALRSTGTCLFLGTGASPHQRLLGQGQTQTHHCHHPKQSQTQTHCPTYCQMHWPIRCKNYCPSPCLFHWQHLHRPLLGGLYHQAPQRHRKRWHVHLIRGSWPLFQTVLGAQGNTFLNHLRRFRFRHDADCRNHGVGRLPLPRSGANGTKRGEAG